MKLISSVSLLLGVFTASAQAQVPAPGPNRPPMSAEQQAMEAGRNAAQQAMAPLLWMVGEWEGPATIAIGEGKSMSLTQRETVQAAAFNTALFIRGRGSMMAGPSERDVFQAAGLLTFDVNTKRFLFASTGGSGAAGTHETSVDGSTFTWSFRVGAGTTTRYVIVHTPADEWRETGGVSTDNGVTWTPNFEMTLVRKR